jgi:hypothetical protein
MRRDGSNGWNEPFIPFAKSLFRNRRYVSLCSKHSFRKRLLANGILEPGTVPAQPAIGSHFGVCQARQHVVFPYAIDLQVIAGVPFHHKTKPAQ